MKIIKVIDLLNMIAKGEEMPMIIKWIGVKFNYINGDYKNDNNCSLFRHDMQGNTYSLLDMLNDEVEIMEEDKKIEKLITLSGYDSSSMHRHYEKINEVSNKINELIDIVNDLKGKSE